jgi:threonine/homoserine/homoserine lactone efflux protein
LSPILQGILAGYGIAIPVGAIAILIVETGLRRGFRSGFSAGAGAASADILYALLAAVAGQTLAAALAPYAIFLRWLSAAVLICLGGWGLWKLAKIEIVNTDRQTDTVKASPAAVYIRFLGLTLLNPLTIAYFGALILGNGNSFDYWGDRAIFVIGAGLASLSWQSLLAGLGALAHRHLSPRFQFIASLLGNLVVIGLGLRMLLF